MESGSKRIVSDRPELSVVMPAYNNGFVIVETLNCVDSAVRQTGLSYEIVVVDDGSVDATKRKASNYANNNGHVKVVGYKRNMGKGYAVKRGFQCAKGKAVIFVDSDLDIDPKQILRYFEALNHGDIVIASKRHPQSKVDTPLTRRILSYGFNVLVKLLVGLRLCDTQTGLKAVRREALAGLFPRLTVKRYAFDVEMLAVANLLGLKIVELPINIRLRSMFSFREVWKMFLDLLGITYRLRVIRWYQRGLAHRDRSDLSV